MGPEFPPLPRTLPRGMISAPTIAALEERGLEYVLGARERMDTLIRTVVLVDTRPFTPLGVRRSGGEETQLWVKEVRVEGRRQIVCRNEAEAEENAADRRDIVAALDQQLKRGDKALIDNSAYRRYLHHTGQGRAFEIDPGKLADEACYGGVFVLRTNARLTPLQAVVRYRDLMQVEQLFKATKLEFVPSSGVAGECCQAVEHGPGHFHEVARSP